MQRTVEALSTKYDKAAQDMRYLDLAFAAFQNILIQAELRSRISEGLDSHFMQSILNRLYNHSIQCEQLSQKVLESLSDIKNTLSVNYYNFK